MDYSQVQPPGLLLCMALYGSSKLYILIERRVTDIRTNFHEEAHGRSRASVCPQDDIVTFWISSAVEEIEEYVTSFNVNVTCVCAAKEVTNVII